MPDGNDSVTSRVLSRMAELPAAQWDALDLGGNPFLRHAFLTALEESGSASAQTGWQPCHLLLEDADGRLLAAAPLYAKSHSYGEYVFDWSWADAYQRAGGAYYPKLQGCVPFTPVTGPRLLTIPGPAAAPLRRALALALVRLAERSGMSSLHITFPAQAEWTALGEAGLLQRLGEQYHWHNPGYASFEDFLAQLSSRKRKAIRKERERAASLGLTYHSLTGPQIEQRHWDALWRCYLDTTGRKWGQPYLTRDFFDRLGQIMADRVVLMVAEQAGQPVACALNLLGDDTLYGRNWGTLGDWPFLHFELCYYRAMDYAIAHGLKRVEAGAQGEHKISRGYLPTATYSAHWIADPGFRTAVDRFLRHERAAVQEDLCADQGPFRKMAEVEQE